MIFKFSLYGFLKNQQYYEPFFILFCMEKGLNFAMIGLLIAFREICICILEIPTGAIADVAGRRRSMMLAFATYIISLLIFSFSSSTWALFVAMFFFSIGEAFRTGTHKAIIFDWLSHENRADEKTEIYGLTRSWSKMGSAFSLPIAASIVFLTGNYANAFLFATIPCMMNIINFCNYPEYLDGPKATHLSGSSVHKILNTLFTSIKKAISNSELRRLLLESMAYEGIFRATKDYLQPILQAFALSLAFMPALTKDKRTAIIIGIVYVILYLLSSLASRNTGKFAKHAGGEAKAARKLWMINLLTFLILGIAIWQNINLIIIAAFILIAILQNFWRPILISRCADLTEPSQTATILSIESQAKSLFTAIMAPILGWSIDYVGGIDSGLRFIPVALLGVIVSALVLLLGKEKSVIR
jgi:MFS family permease